MNEKDLIRLKARIIKNKGISYAAMSRACGVGSSTIRNFVSGYRKGMEENNWEKFSFYIEQVWNLLGEETRVYGLPED